MDIQVNKNLILKGKIFKHFKNGHEYIVSNIIFDGTVDEEKVKYKPLYKHQKYNEFTRSIDDFLGRVIHNGEIKNRFNEIKTYCPNCGSKSFRFNLDEQNHGIINMTIPISIQNNKEFDFDHAGVHCFDCGMRFDPDSNVDINRAIYYRINTLLNKKQELLYV